MMYLLTLILIYQAIWINKRCHLDSASRILVCQRSFFLTSYIYLCIVLSNLFSQVFGPLLPIVDIESLEDAIDFINDR